VQHRLRVLALEPYYGGSHRAVLDCLVSHIEGDWTILSLPARKWKWRMRGAAITMAREARRLDNGLERYDVVFASTFLNLAEFKGLAGEPVAGVPTVVYFHENQLVYPNRHMAEWDLQFPLTNVTSALAADECWFNTQWNLDRFLEAIGPLFRQFPDHRPKGLEEAIAEKSSVLPPPFDPEPFDALVVERGSRCRVVWPHRWEHDKDPQTFFDVMGSLAAEGLDFEVVIAGQSFAEMRETVARAADRLGDRLVHLGEPRSRQEYAGLLAGCDIAVSTAMNEFFGLAMIEAAYVGCYPLVPDRLAYRELYPSEMRYGSAEALAARLRSLILERPTPGQGKTLASRFTVASLQDEYSAAFRHVAAH
jgi:glycosyltransferase involved in cell wall biosynthesis